MALTKEKKQQVVDEVGEMLNSSKLTVLASYDGTGVKALQALRKQARENATSVKVIKNRLVLKALSSNETFKDSDTSAVKGQLLYAFNSEDEVAPAQVLATFAKTQTSLQFVGAFMADGTFISADEVKALASLPSKAQLVAGIISTLNSPVRGVVSGLQGNLHGILQALEAKAAN